MRNRQVHSDKSKNENPEVVNQNEVQEQVNERRSTSKLSQLAVALAVLYLCVPIAVRLFPIIMYHVVFSHVARIPFFADLSRPADLALNHTVNLYLSSEEGITLGVWHTVPDSLWEKAQEKDLEWYQETLKDGFPIIIYLHGNGGTRGAGHRIGLINVLSAAGFHVVCMDYRGYGDSSGEPSEAGMTTDTIHLYQWVKARSGDSLVIIWGHSLGTGVATNTVLELQKQGINVDGLILEGAFSNIRQAGAVHPFAAIYRKFPFFEYFFLDTISRNNLKFPNDENVKKLKAPLLILHSEDDHIIPYYMGEELFKSAQNSRNSDNTVTMVGFKGSHGYRHNGAYQDPEMPQIIRAFVSSLHI